MSQPTFSHKLDGKRAPECVLRWTFLEVGVEAALEITDL